MEALYWGLLVFGVIYALVTLIFSDLLEHAFHFVVGDTHVPFLQPTVLVSGLTSIGAIGILLTRYSLLHTGFIVTIAVAGAILIAVLVYFLYIKPMENSENSIGYSIHELVGSIGDVSIAIPAQGYGEVLIKVGVSNTNQIAASFDGIAIAQDSRVVVIEVREHTVFVSILE
ncbi:protease [Paenibacillus sp. ACRRX]|uniref:protease n=1 Tax=Paenibacillus sp. ACRRX TaxID=2918206 RepID=UPI001EF67851|nr:protease [Paenibacillus sp. ACRRX]MCG7410387.1 protease [Paenibacillus sp. ACRRX]